MVDLLLPNLSLGCRVSLKLSDSKQWETTPQYLSDLRGGYLCSPSSSIFKKQIKKDKLLTSRDLSHFHLKFNSKHIALLCNCMNSLQSVSFEVNSDVLRIINDNRSLLEEKGLLLPLFLGRLNVKESIDLACLALLEKHPYLLRDPYSIS